MWFASTLGDPANGPLMMISTLIKGEGAMAAGTASPSLGMLVHLVLSAVFGIAFAVVAPSFRTNGTIAIAGTIYGGLLYVVNFLVVTPLAFPIFQNANQPFEVVVHLLFGLVLSLGFFGSGVRAEESVVSLRRVAA